MEDITYLSFSKISSYAGCSLKYYFSRILKLPVVSEKTQLLFGGSGHETLAFIHRTIKDTGEPPPITDAISKFKDKFTNELLFNEINIPKPEMTSLFEMGENLITKYYDTFKNTDLFKIRPLAIEMEFEIPLIDYSTGEIMDDIIFNGYIDLIQEYENMLYIIDHKFTRSAYNEHKINTSMQLTLYAYALKYLIENNIIENKKNLDIGVAFTGLYKQKTPRVLFHPSKRSDDDIKRMLAITKSALKGMNAGIYVPNFDHPYCSSCEFLEACNLWGKYEEKEWMDIYLKIVEEKQKGNQMEEED